MEKHKNIPTLRFPEFRGEWERKKLEEIADKRIQKNKDNSINNVFTNSATQGIVNQRDYFDKDIANQDNLLNYYVVEKDDFIYNPRISSYAPVGPISRNHIGSGVMSPLYSVFRINKGNLDFFEVYFSTSKWYEYMESIANYGARADRMSITTGDFYLMPLPFPSLPEQEKIASFFTVIDKKIAGLKQKKNLLEQYKKGVMQKIFSQELRFKDDNGKEFPEWEEKRLGEIAEINPKCEKLPQSFIYIDLESVVQGRLNKEERITINEAPSRAQRLIRKNDILFQMVRPYQKNNYFFDKNEIDYVASTGYAQIRTLENPLFIFQLLHTVEFVNKVIERCTGTGYPAINSTDLSNIEVWIPSIKEQAKIANFLLAIDDKINNVQTQIKQTEQYKKGLLQQMFC